MKDLIGRIKKCENSVDEACARISRVHVNFDVKVRVFSKYAIKYKNDIFEIYQQHPELAKCYKSKIISWEDNKIIKTW